MVIEISLVSQEYDKEQYNWNFSRVLRLTAEYLEEQVKEQKQMESELVKGFRICLRILLMIWRMKKSVKRILKSCLK